MRRKRYFLVQKQAEQEQQSQAASSNQANTQTNSASVYIAASGNGKCYHNNPNCSNMNGNVITMTMDEAQQSGYRACKKCY